MLSSTQIELPPVQKDAFRIQILSDVHVEINVDSTFDRNPTENKKEQIKKNFTDNKRLPRFSVKAPYLALLGDIGYPHSWALKEFLAEQASRFEKVFLVAGNHEFYSTPSFKPSKEEVINEIKKICSEHENLIFLNKDVHIIDNFRIIGTTLWEPYPNDSNDTTKIYVTPNQKLTNNDSKQWHLEEFNYIQTELENSKKNNQQSIVMTHHPPPHLLVKIAKQYEGYFPVWMHGHTHVSSSCNFSKTLVVSNQVGYLQLGHKDGSFFPECVVEARGGVGEVLLLMNEYEIKVAEEKAKEASEWEKMVKTAAPPPPPPPRK